MEYLRYLEILSQNDTRTVSQSLNPDSQRTILSYLSPLLLAPVSPIAWSALRPLLRDAFQSPQNISSISRGWSGLDALILVFRRLDWMLDENETAEVRDWLKNIVGVIKRELVATRDPTLSYNSPYHDPRLTAFPEGDVVQSGLKRSRSTTSTALQSCWSGADLKTRQSQQAVVASLPSPVSLPPNSPPPGFRFGTCGEAPILRLEHHAALPCEAALFTTRPLGATTVRIPSATALAAPDAPSPPHSPCAVPTPISPRPGGQSATPPTPSIRAPLPCLPDLIVEALSSFPSQSGFVSSIVSFITSKYPLETRREKTWEDLVRGVLNVDSRFEGKVDWGDGSEEEGKGKMECSEHEGKKKKHGGRGKKGKLWRVATRQQRYLTPPEEDDGLEGSTYVREQQEGEELEQYKDGKRRKVERSGVKVGLRQGIVLK